MNDLISREELIKEVCGKCDGACDCCSEENCIQCKRPNMRCDFRKDLDDAPTVDAVPVVHGHWILEREPDGKPYAFHCSVCDDDFHRIGNIVASDYCPDCGAKMDGGEINGT